MCLKKADSIQMVKWGCLIILEGQLNQPLSLCGIDFLFFRANNQKFKSKRRCLSRCDLFHFLDRMGII